MDTHCQTCTDIMSDYCDGKIYKTHPLFSTDPVALQLILYYDELELCNPLGSRRKKHKIGTCTYLYMSACLLNNTCHTCRSITLSSWEHKPTFSIKDPQHTAPSLGQILISGGIWDWSNSWTHCGRHRKTWVGIYVCMYMTCMNVHVHVPVPLCMYMYSTCTRSVRAVKLQAHMLQHIAQTLLCYSSQQEFLL